MQRWRRRKILLNFWYCGNGSTGKEVLIDNLSVLEYFFLINHFPSLKWEGGGEGVLCSPENIACSECVGVAQIFFFIFD